MKGYINGKPFEAEQFGFDGCHKFYLCDTAEGQRQLEEYGYTLYPIEELPGMWEGSCPLRFVMSADLEREYVRQCEPAEFVGWEIDERLRKEIEFMGLDQRYVNGEISLGDLVARLYEIGYY